MIRRAGCPRGPGNDHLNQREIIMDYDYMIIGSGPAGHVSALKAAQIGMKVCVVEKERASFGGVCLNEGCIPAKSLYRSAAVYELMKTEGTDFGLGNVSLDGNIGFMVERSVRDSETLKKGLESLFEKNGIDVLYGHASFLDPDTVMVTGDAGEKRVRASKTLIATGSRPRPLNDIPFNGINILSSSHAIKLTEVPDSMVIVGGGYIGVEMASYFDLLGCDITIIEYRDRILPTEDKDISRRMRSLLKKRGIRIRTSSAVSGISGDGPLEIHVGTGDEKEDIIKAGKILVSIGREPLVEGLSLEKAGLATDQQGFIGVDGSMRTNVGHIYAAGDVVRGPMLAHSAYAEGEIAALDAAGHDHGQIDHDNIPNAVYSHVPAASTGYTEEKATEAGIEVSVGKTLFRANGKAVINRSPEGFIKVIADRGTGKILGAHIIGDHAQDMIHEFVLARKAGMTAGQVASAVHAHPTLSESVVEACRAVSGVALHG
ncbi:MAG: dihydrolipoyl dehydrogenase [Candidatus Omnitrophica bacterium]|nr:dihydrolipoyl dehydrogenase [Candidatus Omnitrophota bacterium]